MAIVRHNSLFINGDEKDNDKVRTITLHDHFRQIIRRIKTDLLQKDTGRLS